MKKPPFDGSTPCPMCPDEMRGLYAVAHNITVGSRDTTIGDLKRAVEAAKPFIDKHFADRMHSHGELPREDEPPVNEATPKEGGNG